MEEDDNDKDVVENNGLFLGSMSVSLPEYKSPQVLNVDRATPDRSPSKSSKVKRTLKVNIMLDWREYEANDGKKQSEAEEITDLDAVADTGADVCCTSPKEAMKMGFKPSELLRHPITLQSANGQKLRIQGYLPVFIYTRDLNGEFSAMAREQMFIIVGCKKTILSRKALIALGSISPNFPEVAPISVPKVHEPQSSIKDNEDEKIYPHPNIKDDPDEKMYPGLKNIPFDDPAAEPGRRFNKPADMGWVDYVYNLYDKYGCHGGSTSYSMVSELLASVPLQSPEMSTDGSRENLAYEVYSVQLSKSKDSFKPKKKRSQKQKFKGAPATKMPITPKEVIDMKVGDITDSTNSVADGVSPGGGANSPVVVKPAPLNYFLSRQVWRPWAD